MRIDDLAITGIETIDLFGLITGDYLFTLDELQDATISQTQDKNDVTGKGGRKITSLKRNKAVTVSGTSGLVSSGLLELQTGGDFEEKDTEILWTETLTVSSDAATTKYKAVGTTGNEIGVIYVKDKNEIAYKKIEQDSEVKAGKFTYTPSTKAIAFNTGEVPDNTEIVVKYKRKVTAPVLENLSDVYSKQCTMYVNALAEDKCGNVYRVQYYIPKADFSGEFEQAFGDDQTTHAFEAEALAGACGAGGKLWSYTIFGENIADKE
jgi:hypothetical protein